MHSNDYNEEYIPQIPIKIVYKVFHSLPKNIQKTVLKRVFKHHLKDIIYINGLFLAGFAEMMIFPEEATAGLFICMMSLGLGYNLYKMIVSDIYKLSLHKRRILRIIRGRRRKRRNKTSEKDDKILVYNESRLLSENMFY